MLKDFLKLESKPMESKNTRYIDWYHTSSVLSLEVHKSNYRAWNSIIWDQIKTQKNKKILKNHHEKPNNFPQNPKKKV
jgi:hypothetical protein